MTNMKKLIILLVFILTTFLAKAQEKKDTVKKYILRLTETEYKSLIKIMEESAAYEAEVQRQNIVHNNYEFLKQNTDTITVYKPKEIK